MLKDNFASQSPLKEDDDRRIAIVGMSCLFPEAAGLAPYWQNIVDGVDCTRLVSEAEWSTERFYEPLRKNPEQDSHLAENPKARQFDKVFCRRGGFITDLADFDPLQVGVMPKAVDGSDPDQMLALKLACQAIADAGYNTKPFSAEKAEVIIGRTAAPGHGVMNLIQTGQTVGQFIDLVSKLLPDLSSSQKESLADELRNSLHPCNPDTIVGVMPSVLAARIAGRLGFKGRSLVLDAACASSLIAVEMAVENLRSHRSDMALAGGVFINSFAVFYQMFCGLGALSHTETIRPFDDNADGTLLGEGIGMVVLKRLSDAIRDGDKIYACIAGVGSSSNGSGTSMLAPSADGEALALRRAYDDAGFSAKTVSLIEAHGTGTISGDLAEMQALEQVFLGAPGEGSERHKCALGSVKSMIGHCQAASGIAGLIKATLALYHRVLPATINVKKPNSHIDWDNSFFYINTKTRPWIHPKLHPRLRAILPHQESPSAPRRAAVSAFGFGGVNAHTVLEEYDQANESSGDSYLYYWENEVFTFVAIDRAQLIDKLASLHSTLSQQPSFKLKDLAYSVNKTSAKAEEELAAANSKVSEENSKQFERLGIVASSIQDLTNKLAVAQNALAASTSDFVNKEFVKNKDYYYSESKVIKSGKLAFILPGLGAAYPNMLAELCIHFPDVRAVFDFVDQLSALSGETSYLSDKIFPPPQLGGVSETSASLATMDAAVVTVLMAEWALFTLLINLGVMPDVLLGCSTGEFAALTMGGATDIISAASIFYKLSTSVANSIPKEELAELRSVMIAAPYATIEKYTKKYASIYLSADLSNKQVILSGSKGSIEELVKDLNAAAIEVHMLPSAIPYHTPLVEGVIETDQEDLSQLEINALSIPAWSCSSAAPYPEDPEAIREITTRLFTKPILFRKSIESLYAAGFTKFVEVGPRDTLSSIVSEVLTDQPHIAVASNRSTGSALSQLNHLAACLYSQGVSLNLEYLYLRRDPKMLDLNSLVANQTKPRSSMMKLDLTYPELKLQEGWQERTGLSQFLDSQSQPNSVKSPGSFKTDMQEVPHARPATTELEKADGNDVLSSYFKSLTHFHANLMRTQEEVMLSYLSQADEPNHDFNTSDFSVPNNQFPLLAGAIFNQAGDSLAVDINLDLDSHKYLLDHAIGGLVRGQLGSAEKVYLLPLTVAIELMAETSSFLYPGLKVVAVNNVRAYKRIRVTGEGLPVRIEARPSANSIETTEVAIYKLPRDNSNGLSTSDPLMSCEITFSHDYPAKPQIPADLESPSSFLSSGSDWYASSLNQSKLYGLGAMFHGPRMQSVVSVDAVAERKVVGRVKAKPAEDWFDSNNRHENYSRNFLVDPLLLDNATQLVLFHLFEHSEPVNALLPFLLESLRFYDNLGTINGDLVVRAKLNSLTPRSTEGDVYICTEDGLVVAEFRSITSRRIVLDDNWHKFIFDTDRTFLTEDLMLLLEQLELKSENAKLSLHDLALSQTLDKLSLDIHSEIDIKSDTRVDASYDKQIGLDNLFRSIPNLDSQVALRIINDERLPKDEATLSWCADYLLMPVEIQDYEALSGFSRKREWLLGRIAAKEAVRSLAYKLFAIQLSSADVVIVINVDGKPFVADIHISGINWQPPISISHKNGTAIAIAVDNNLAKSVGIDLESISPREHGFENLALTEQERSRFQAELSIKRDTFLAQTWSAKEAAGKALGSGLSGNPGNFEIAGKDSTDFQYIVRLTNTAKTILDNNVSRANNATAVAERTFQSHQLTFAEHVLSIVIVD